MQECANCRSTADLHVHHIVPRGLGGTERPSNKVTLCADCHAKVHGWGSGYAEAWKAGMERIKNGAPKPPSYGTPTKRTPEVLAEIKRATSAGEKATDIAARLGMSLFTLRAARKELGFPPRLPTGRRPRTAKLSDWKRRTREQQKRRTARQEAKRRLKRQKQLQLFEITGQIQ